MQEVRTVDRRRPIYGQLLAISLMLVVAGCDAGTASPSAHAASGPPTASVGATPGQEIAPLPFPLDATIPELQEAMEAGELSAVELVDFYLARIAAYDDSGPELNAFIVHAKAASYVGDGEHAPPCRTGSHDLRISDSEAATSSGRRS